MSVDLYEHQRKAVDELKTGAVLCGGVGTGKSRTSLAYYYEKVLGGKLPKKGQDKFVEPSIDIPLYIITTARKRDTGEWRDELVPFLLNDADVTIDSWNNITKYVDVAKAFFIFDEQRLVGSGTWVKSFLKIAKSNQWILLSATPGDTWLDYCPVFIANGFYKNRTQFIREHVVYSRFSKYPRVDRYVGTGKLKALRNKIVIEMEAEKTAIQHHEWIKVGYDESDYKLVLDNRWDFVKDQPIRNVPELCYILRKIVNSDRRRLQAVSHLLEKHPKAIIFYNFDYELDMLKGMLEAIDQPYSEWNGHKHQPILYDENRWAYLVQYTAGAEGWNCIETDTIIFYSQNYSYRSTVQASGRIDRMNTSFTDLYYFHLFSDAPIDAAIKQCLKKKKNFNEATFIKPSQIDDDDPFREKYEQLSLF